MVRSMGTAWGVGGEGRSVLRSGVARASDAQGLQFKLTALCAVKLARRRRRPRRPHSASKQLAVMIASLLYALGAVPLITLNNGVQMPAVAAGTWGAAPHHPTCTPCLPPAEP